MGNPLKKAFKSINKAANKIADKLIPKELAPFLPILGAFAPGLGLAGTGVFNQYILPQLLTAASSAKMQGEIDPMQQAITGIMSALQGPVKQTAAEKELIKQNPELVERLKKANQLEEGLSIDASKLRELSQKPGQQIFGTDASGSPFGRFTEAINEYNPFGIDADDVLQFGQGDEAQFFLKDSAALDDFLSKTVTEPVAGIENLTGDKLISELSKAEGFDADKITGMLDDIYDVSGKPNLQIALNKARGFFDTPIGFNYPTLAKVGIGASPFLGAQAEQLKDEQDALLAQQEADRDAFNSSRQALTEYFRRLSDPTGMFAAEGGRAGFKEGGKSGGGMLSGLLSLLDPRTKSGKTTIGLNEVYDILDPSYALSLGSLFGLYNEGGQVNEGIMSAAPGMPQGMQVDGRNGTFIPMGVKEKADDVPAMLSKNEFVMTADAVRGMGNGDVNSGAQKMYDLMNSLEARV